MRELTTETFNDFINAETPALVDFWAGWCMPCKVFAPVLEELSDELDGKVNFGKLNIDDFGEIAQQYSIVSIPTVILFKNGKPVDQMVGVRPKQEIADTLSKHLD